MENCTIYSHQLAFDKVVEIIKTTLAKAKVEVSDNGLQKSLVATIKGGFFGKNKTLKINYRQRDNPSYKLDQVECGLTQNLVGMVNFIQSLPSKNEQVKNKFVIKVMSINSEMSFMAEPEITPEFKSVLQEITTQLDAFVFAQPSKFFNKSNGQHFLDKNLNLILDPNGNCQIDDINVNVDAKYQDQPATEYTDDQITRKTASEILLAKNDIKVNKNLPCIASTAETILRNKKEIIDRAYALLITAAKGEGVEQEHLSKIVEGKNITSLSPKEKTIFDTASLNDNDKVYATWRYESLNTLLWALGKMDTLKYPSDICDVKDVVGKMIEPSRADFESSVTLRDKEEILNKLDETYRTNWACVDAKIKGQEVSGNINPSVVYERHYTLNWLTNYQNKEWDQVKTNT